MTRKALVSFFWHGAPAALLSSEVLALLDAPAVAPLATPLGTVNQIVAYESHLFPLIDDPDLAGSHVKFTTIIVIETRTGGLALRVGSNVRVEHGEVESSIVVFPDGKTALLLDAEELLEQATGCTLITRDEQAA